MRINKAKKLSFNEVIAVIAKENNLSVELFVPCAYKYVANEVGGFNCDPFGEVNSIKQPEEILEMLWTGEELALEYVEYFQDNNECLDTVSITMYEALEAFAFSVYLWKQATDIDQFDYAENQVQYINDSQKMMIEIEFSKMVNISDVGLGSIKVIDGNRSTTFDTGKYIYVCNTLYISISEDFDYASQFISNEMDFNMELVGNNTRAELFVEEIVTLELDGYLSFKDAVTSVVLKYANNVIPVKII